MKIKRIPLVAFFVLALLLQQQNRLQAENQTTGYRLQATGPEAPSSLQITASDYCSFLNAVAAEDSCGLYDEKIGSQATDYRLQTTGPEIATVCGLIIRSGEPGHYCYAVTEGKEECAINYADQISGICYNDWSNNAASTSTLNFNCCEVAASYFAACDEQLRSNRIDLQIINAGMNDLFTTKNSDKKEGDEASKEEIGIRAYLLSDKTWKTILGVGGLFVTAEYIRRMPDAPRNQDAAIARTPTRNSSTGSLNISGRNSPRGVLPVLQDDDVLNTEEEGRAEVQTGSLSPNALLAQQILQQLEGQRQVVVVPDLPRSPTPLVRISDEQEEKNPSPGIAIDAVKVDAANNRIRHESDASATSTTDSLTYSPLNSRTTSMVGSLPRGQYFYRGNSFRAIREEHTAEDEVNGVAEEVGVSSSSDPLVATTVKAQELLKNADQSNDCYQAKAQENPAWEASDEASVLIIKTLTDYLAHMQFLDKMSRELIFSDEKSKIDFLEKVKNAAVHWMLRLDAEEQQCKVIQNEFSDRIVTSSKFQGRISAIGKMQDGTTLINGKMFRRYMEALQEYIGKHQGDDVVPFQKRLETAESEYGLLNQIMSSSRFSFQGYCEALRDRYAHALYQARSSSEPSPNDVVLVARTKAAAEGAWRSYSRRSLVPVTREEARVKDGGNIPRKNYLVMSAAEAVPSVALNSDPMKNDISQAIVYALNALKGFTMLHQGYHGIDDAKGEEKQKQAAEIRQQIRNCDKEYVDTLNGMAEVFTSNNPQEVQTGVALLELANNAAAERALRFHAEASYLERLLLETPETNTEWFQKHVQGIRKTSTAYVLKYVDSLKEFILKLTLKEVTAELEGQSTIALWVQEKRKRAEKALSCFQEINRCNQAYATEATAANAEAHTKAYNTYLTALEEESTRLQCQAALFPQDQELQEQAEDAKVRYENAAKAYAGLPLAQIRIPECKMTTVSPNRSSSTQEITYVIQRSNNIPAVVQQPKGLPPVVLVSAVEVAQANKESTSSKTDTAAEKARLAAEKRHEKNERKKLKKLAELNNAVSTSSQENKNTEEVVESAVIAVKPLKVSKTSSTAPVQNNNASEVAAIGIILDHHENEAMQQALENSTGWTDVKAKGKKDSNKHSSEQLPAREAQETRRNNSAKKAYKKSGNYNSRGNTTSSALAPESFPALLSTVPKTEKTIPEKLPTQKEASQTSQVNAIVQKFTSKKPDGEEAKK